MPQRPAPPPPCLVLALALVAALGACTNPSKLDGVVNGEELPRVEGGFYTFISWPGPHLDVVLTNYADACDVETERLRRGDQHLEALQEALDDATTQADLDAANEAYGAAVHDDEVELLPTDAWSARFSFAIAAEESGDLEPRDGEERRFGPDEDSLGVCRHLVNLDTLDCYVADTGAVILEKSGSRLRGEGEATLVEDDDPTDSEGELTFFFDVPLCEEHGPAEDEFFDEYQRLLLR